MTSAVFEYYNKHRQLILDNLQLSARDDNIDPVHDMRVSFKRLKILLQFLEKLSNGKVIARKENNHFNNFYKISGRLRDLHVQKQLLDNYIEVESKSYNDYFDYLSKGIQKRNIKYQGALADFDTDFFKTNFDQLFKSILTKVSDQTIIDIAGKILDDKSNAIRQFYQQGHDEKRFHEIRRSMKDIQYLNNMLNDELPIRGYLNIDSSRLTELGQILGSWHDKLTAEKVLSRFVKNNLGHLNDPDVYSDLLQQIEKDKNSEYQYLDKIFIQEIKLG
jgi:CHAD domain-containing protein